MSEVLTLADFPIGTRFKIKTADYHKEHFTVTNSFDNQISAVSDRDATLNFGLPLCSLEFYNDKNKLVFTTNEGEGK